MAKDCVKGQRQASQHALDVPKISIALKMVSIYIHHRAYDGPRTP